MAITPDYSVVVPAYRAGAKLARALEGLLQAQVPPERIVVVDDASGDDTAGVARSYGVHVEVSSQNRGPAGARNLGAAVIKNANIIFVDADVIVHPDAINRLLDGLKKHPAVFGSYDTNPDCPGRISRIRNLFHHWTHQGAGGEVVSFWTGLGGIRRDVFEEVGGFNEEIDFMEDVDLGIRLWRAGHKVVLDPDILCTHLKSWTLRSMLWTDFWGRAVPWSRLITAPENRDMPKALNAGTRGQSTVLLVAASLIGLAATFLTPWALTIPLACVLLIALLHREFLALLAREGQPGDRVAAVGLIWLIHLMAGLGYAFVLAENRLPVRRTGPT